MAKLSVMISVLKRDSSYVDVIVRFKVYVLALFVKDGIKIEGILLSG
jgi:hypothetical protein